MRTVAAIIMMIGFFLLPVLGVVAIWGNETTLMLRIAGTDLCLIILMHLIGITFDTYDDLASIEDYVERMMMKRDLESENGEQDAAG